MNEEALKKRLITDILQVYAISNISKGNKNLGADNVFMALICLDIHALIKVAHELYVKV